MAPTQAKAGDSAMLAQKSATLSDAALARVEVDLRRAARTLHRPLEFPRALDIEFRHRRLAVHQRQLTSALPWTLLAYNAFLMLDYFILPDVFAISMFIHFGIVSPLILFATLLGRLVRQEWLYSLLAISIPVLMTIHVNILNVLSDSDAVEQHQYLSLFVLLFLGRTVKLNFRWSAVANIALMTIYAVGLMVAEIEPAGMAVGLSGFVATAFINLTEQRQAAYFHRRAFLRRVTDERARQRAEADASIDQLTGLPNRRELDRRFANGWSTGAGDAEEVPQTAAVLMIDIDHFKAFNDQFGHTEGDHCLQKVARQIEDSVRKSDHLAFRFGGEEFTMILPGFSTDAARTVAERLRRKVRAMGIPHARPDGLGIVTVSIGLSVAPLTPDGVRQGIEAADRALYEAKRRGRDAIVVAGERAPTERRQSAMQ